MNKSFTKTHTDPNVIHVLRNSPSRWDRQIVADLIDEMQVHLSENLDSVPAMRSVLAVAGYQALRKRIEDAVNGQQGVEALRTMIHTMRSFALGSPGLAAASFRNPVLDSPEWETAGTDLAYSVFKVFEGVGIVGDNAIHAVRILRSLVRGFVLNEMVSAAAHPLEFQKSYNCAVEMFIAGLPTLAQTHFDGEADRTKGKPRRASLVA